MNELEKQIKIHCIDKITQEVIHMTASHHAPCVGDEMRITETLFYTVIRRVWCFDEPEAQFARLNLEVIRDDLSDT